MGSRDGIVSMLPGQARADVRLGDLTFNTIDDDGCAWVLSDLDGWWNLPEPDLPDDPRAYQFDGSYETDGRYKARDITLTGVIIPDQATPGNVAAARRRLLSGVSAVRSSLALEVDESDASKTASCRLAGRPQVAVSGLNGVLQFQIPLRAPDPRKFSTETGVVSTGVSKTTGGRTYPRTFPQTYPGGSTSGIASFVNEGDYNSNAQIVITGPVTDPSLEHIEQGKSLRFDITLALGDTLTLDLDTHSVVLNDTASRRNAVDLTSQWFTVQPGTNSIRFLGTTSGSPTLTVAYRSAWIE